MNICYQCGGCGCHYCGHMPHSDNRDPLLSIDDYRASAKLRITAIKDLEEKIDFSSFNWDGTRAGQRWKELARQQNEAEAAAGL